MSVPPTTVIKGAERTTTFGQQIGSIGVNTEQNSDISGVRTINLQPYPPVPSGGNLPVGTTVDATLRWDGSAWVQNTSVRASGSGTISAPGDATFRSDAGDVYIAATAPSKTVFVENVSVRQGDVNGIDTINSIPWPVCTSADGNFASGSVFSSGSITFGASAYTAASGVRGFPSGTVVHATMQTSFDITLSGAGAYQVTFTITNANLAMAGIGASWDTCAGVCNMFCNSVPGNPFGSGIIQKASATTAAGFATITVPSPIVGATNFVMVIDFTARVL